MDGCQYKDLCLKAQNIPVLCCVISRNHENEILHAHAGVPVAIVVLYLYASDRMYTRSCVWYGHPLAGSYPADLLHTTAMQ